MRKGMTLAFLFGSVMTLQGCITTPTIVKPNTYELSAKRSLVFDSETPDKVAITDYAIASEIAAIYPATSQYIAYRTSPTFIGSTSCLGDCAGERRAATGSEGIGVKASTVSGNQILVEYIRKVSNSSGNGETVTKTIILVSEDEKKPGHFTIIANELTEKIGIAPGLGFIGIEPVAPIEKIAEDIKETIAKLNPALHHTFYHRAEFSTQYPPNSVFSSYERALGSVKIITTPNNSLEGSFSLPSGSIAAKANIAISPYRNNASIVNIVFGVPYQMTEGGGNTLASFEEIKKLSDTLQKIAFD